MRLVSDLKVLFPEKKSSTFNNGYRSTKPKAQIVCTMEPRETLTLWVPVKVAKSIAKDRPSLPLTIDELKGVVGEREYKCAIHQIGEALERRDHSIEEVRQKLKRYGFSEFAIERAILRASELNLLDDKRFASLYIESRKRSGWGRRKIEQGLRIKGVRTEAIEGYPEAFFSEEDDLSRAFSLLKRKRVPEQKAFEKLVRFLRAKGFSYSVSADAVKEHLSHVQEESDF